MFVIMELTVHLGREGQEILHCQSKGFFPGAVCGEDVLRCSDSKHLQRLRLWGGELGERWCSFCVGERDEQRDL
ncbi:hypothetical protein AOLI_G00072240 [Acnodon oligacanthus]